MYTERTGLIARLIGVANSQICEYRCLQSLHRFSFEINFMVVAQEAKLRFPEVSLGTFVGGGAVYTLAERVGVMKARELIYLGDFFLGGEAAEMGVAYRAVPQGEVLSTAMELAGRLAEKAPISLAWAKRLIGPASTVSRAKALKREGKALLRIFGTRDWKEGVEAFHEKRPPEYTGE